LGVKESSLLYADVPSFMSSPIAFRFEDLIRIRPDVVIFGAPFDGTTTFRCGACRLAPQTIRKFSILSRGYSAEYDIHIKDYLKIADYGDVDIVPGSTAESYSRIEKRAMEILKAKATPLLLGGDHGVTYPVVKALSEHFSSDRIGIIHFDTHMDLRDEFLGDKLGRSCPMRRIAELPNVNPENIVQVGIHGYRAVPEWTSYAREKHITVFSMRDVEKIGIESVTKKALEVACRETSKLYVTVDIDAIDPAYAPGTGSPEFGGLTSREMLTSLGMIGRSGVDGFDLVEVAPEFDGIAQQTSVLSVNLIAELLGALAWRKKSQT